MKLLLFYAPSFWFKTYQKVLASCQEAVVVFCHIEAEDLERRGKVITKFVKNIKWLAGKFDSKKVVLHSFNHLSKSKAPVDFAEALVQDACDRLERAGYSLIVTPFGYLNEWKLHVAGESLAKVFKEI